MLRNQGSNLTVLWYLIQLKCPVKELEELAAHLLAELQNLRSVCREFNRKKKKEQSCFVLLCPSRCLSTTSIHR